MSLASPPHNTKAPPVTHTGLAIGLVYLDRWPDLPSQLSERELLVNRICNELSKKPRASHLIHLLVQAPKDDVQAALRGLLQSGCIHIGQASTVPGTGVPIDADFGETTPPHASAGSNMSDDTEDAGPPSMLSKLWSRISS